MEKERKRTRERNIRLNYSEKYKRNPNKLKHVKSWIKKYPEKRKAQTAVQKFPRGEGTHLHHWSYNKEHHKDVIELTIREHNLLHRFLKYNQETFFYEDLEGNLLNTREKHLNYWDKIKSLKKS